MNPNFDSIHIRAYNPLVPRDAKKLLRDHGVHVTAQRLAVLKAVSSRPHCTADDVAETVRAEIGTISRQAVYDALALLAEKNLIRRIQPAHSPARYEDRVLDNHHHIICRTCGNVADVDCAVGAAPCLTAADDSGYVIDEAEVIFWGQCPACRHQTSAPAGTRNKSVPNPRASLSIEDRDIDTATTHGQTDELKG